MRVRSFTEVPWVQWCARDFATRCGLTPRLASLLTVVATELSTNMLKFASGGELRMRLALSPEALVEVAAEDEGPGFDVEGASASSSGLGLAAVRRLMDDVAVSARAGGGALVVARKHVTMNVGQ